MNGLACDCLRLSDAKAIASYIAGGPATSGGCDKVIHVPRYRTATALLWKAVTYGIA